MSDEIEFEGGFFDDAEVNLNDIPDDMFGFGNDYWAIRIVEAVNPKVTANRDKVGMMLKWAVDHPAYANNKPTQEMRMWVQLPVPKALQGSIAWDPRNDPKDRQVLVQLRDLYLALGFKNDEMGQVNGAKMIYRGAMAKIKPKRNAEGFWEFGLFNMKALPEQGSGDGMNEFAQPSNGPTKSPEELLAEELAAE